MHKLCGLIIILLPGIRSLAQTLQDSIPTSVSLDEIVISANKTEEKKRNIAQPVLYMGKNEIESLQAQSTADVVANAGINVQKSQQGGGSPVIRGFEASRVLLVIDGVRMNNLIYRTGHLQNIVTTDNSILDRVEVLFGPSSTIYGSDALGGVIHLYTRQPKFAQNDKTNLIVNALARYGSVNREKTGHIDVNLGGKRIASVTSFTFSDFDDLKGGSNQNPFYISAYGVRPYYVKRINGTDSLFKNDDRFVQRQSGYNQYDLLQKFSYMQNSNVIHTVNLQYSTSSDIPRYDRLTDATATGLKYAEWYYGPQERFLAAYDLKMFCPSSFIQQFHAGVNYQQIEESRHSRRFNSPILQNQFERVNVAGLNLDATRSTAEHVIHSGIDIQFNTLESTAHSTDIAESTEVPMETRYPDGDNSMTNAALYVSHSWNINPELILNDGVRVGIAGLKSTFKDTSFFRLPYSAAEQNNAVYSGSIGLVHLPSSDTRLSLLVSTGFRVPNVDDLSKVFESADGVLIVPNSGLKPEKTINYEAGIVKIWRKRTEWDNAIYYTQLYDAIVTDRFKFNGSDSVIYNGTPSAIFANQNKQRAYIYGLSSTFISGLSETLTFSASLSYTYGRIKTDSSDYPLDHIPPVNGKLKLSYLYKKLNGSLQVNFNGWKRLKDYNLNGEDNEQYATPDGMPAWFTVNMHVSYRICRLVSLQAGIDNAFDTQYRVFSSGINAPGRNLFMALRFHY